MAFLHETLGTVIWSHERTRDERTEALARAALEEGRFNQEFAAGRRLSITEAARLALDAVREPGSESYEPLR